MRVDPDIVAARGLPLDFYRSAEHFERQRQGLLARTWHFLAASNTLGVAPGSVSPHSLLPGSLDEPVVLVRGDDGAARCLSNVCSHRAAQVVTEPGVRGQLRCPYHGRCFDLEGRVRSAPGFESPSGDLADLPLRSIGPFLFATIEAAQPFPALDPRLAELPWDALRLDRGACSSWEVQAHWALYVENYLEGLHIPFVHRALAETLDWKRYRYQQFPGGTLQVGIAAEGEQAFDGEGRVAAWYLWLFPTTMLNIYPWGVSLNRVLPMGPSRTGIEFQTWVWRPDLRGAGAGSGLDHVEREDEAIVESVQRGVRSTLARRAEYSPQHEQGVHHFHRMLAELLGESG
jgi:choline monooxygenase